MLPFDHKAQEAAHWISLSLDSAVSIIDHKFGQGFAKAHPELVGAFLSSCATYMSAKISADATSQTYSGLSEIASAMQSFDSLPLSGLPESE